MKLELKIDYEGNPYLECYQSGSGMSDELMEIFIRKTKKEGLIVVNESSFDHVDDYISIRLAKSSHISLNRERRIVKWESKNE